MKFSRFMDGQEVSAYTQNDKPYTGRVYKNNEGIKVVVDEDGKWIKLTELKAVKQVGRKLNEEAEQDFADQAKKFNDYFTTTFDSDKVSKADDKVKDKIINQYIDSSDDNVIRTAKDEFAKTCKDQINGKLAQDKIDAGNSTPDLEIEKLKKENSDDSNTLAESLINSKDIQKSILKERELKKEQQLREAALGEDANVDVDMSDDDVIDSDFSSSMDYQAPADDYGMDDEHQFEATDACDEMLAQGKSKDEIINYLTTEFEISNDEAEDLYNSLADDDLFNNSSEENASVPITDEDTGNNFDFDAISDSVDDEFENQLDNFEASGKPYTDEGMVNEIAAHFGLDGTSALHECNNCPQDAILKLAEQEKHKRLYEITVQQFGNQLIKRCGDAIAARAPNVSQDDMRALVGYLNHCGTVGGIDGDKKLFDDKATSVEAYHTFINDALYYAINGAAAMKGNLNPRMVHDWLVTNKERFGANLLNAAIDGATASNIAVENDQQSISSALLSPEIANRRNNIRGNK